MPLEQYSIAQILCYVYANYRINEPENLGALSLLKNLKWLQITRQRGTVLYGRTTFATLTFSRNLNNNGHLYDKLSNVDHIANVVD